MTGTREHEPLADAFTAFRAEASGEIRPPGTTSARLVVTRRRRARVGALAALVAVGLAGAGYLATDIAAPTDRPGPAAASPEPTRGADELQRLGVDALARLGRTPTDTRPGVVFGPLDQASGSFRYELGSAAEPFPAGEYTLQAVCVGAGNATASWAVGGQTYDLAVSCDGVVRTFPFGMPAPGTVALTVRPDPAAVDRAGVAVAVTDPLQVRAAGALGDDTTGLRSGGAGVADANHASVDETPYEAGHYVLRVACAGTGTLEATLTIGRSSRSATVECREGVGMVDIPLDVTSERDGGTVTIQPDATAQRGAGYAYRVVRGR